MSYAWPSLLLPSLDFSFSLHQFLWYFLLPSFPLPPILINHTIFCYGENGFKWFSSKPSPCCCYSVTFKLQIWAWLLQSPACFDPAYLTNTICSLSFSVILFQALVCSLKGFTQSSVRWECFLPLKHTPVYFHSLSLDLFSNATSSKKSLGFQVRFLLSQHPVLPSYSTYKYN